MEKLYKGDEIAKKVIDFCLGKYKFIFISGNGGSGKTTLSHQLVKEINSRGLHANCIDMDEFMIDSKIRKSSKKEWVDALGNKRISYLTWAFKESYNLDSLETCIHSLKNGKDCSYKSKSGEEVVLKSECSITIIEGVGTAFLKKEEITYGIFVMCDFKHEVDRRINRARDGETNLSREEVEGKATERNEQFEVTILPEKNKFDLELWSLDDHSFRIDRDNLTVL
ncbi:AAA family ATPase [Candidatus Nomurabacteria bacterium]|nr:AAA family ATPase [Candidatus Nomurabacteria bacterium]